MLRANLRTQLKDWALRLGGRNASGVEWEITVNTKNGARVSLHFSRIRLIGTDEPIAACVRVIAEPFRDEPAGFLARKFPIPIRIDLVKDL